jgi:hypothetical protein
MNTWMQSSSNSLAAGSATAPPARQAQLARKPREARTNGADNAILESELVQRLEVQEVHEWQRIVQERSVEFQAARSASSSAARRGSSDGAVAKTGGKVAELASKAKTPLLAGGAALAGVAGGVALKSRNQGRRPIGKLKSVSLPKSLKSVDLGKLDVKTLTDAARTVRSIGEQVGDVADAADKTRKKHK